MGTYAVTGSASGMGAASAARLREAGHRVVGVDLRDADVTADLGTADGRRHAADEILRLCGGALDGVAAVAGVGPNLPTRPPSPRSTTSAPSPSSTPCAPPWSAKAAAGRSSSAPTRPPPCR